MIELMLKLLTYEPYEKVSGNEKDYIDKVLSEKITSDTVVTNKEYIIYDELFRGFMGFLNYSSKGILWKSIQWDSIGWLRDWKNKYYPVNDGMPYNEFLTHLCNSKRKEIKCNDLRAEAHNWRKNNIIENYASGAWV